MSATSARAPHSDARCRHHFSTPDAQLLQAGLGDRDRQLCDVDALLLELVLQVK